MAVPQERGLYSVIHDLTLNLCSTATCIDTFNVAKNTLTYGATEDFDAGTIDACKDSCRKVNQLSFGFSFSICNRSNIYLNFCC